MNAERFKKVVTAPKGTCKDTHLTNNQQRLTLQYVKELIDSESDDEFFHLTCHVEPQRRQKIERGEFVELENLLPKG